MCPDSLKAKLKRFNGLGMEMTEKAIIPNVHFNEGIAQRLDEVARLLNEQNANPYRVQAYRRAARSIRNQEEPISALIRREGMNGLRRLPGIGVTLARFIYQIVTTGSLPMLARLRGEIDPVSLLATVPGIGKVSADRLHHDLGIETLEELEASAYDDRLAGLAGFGEKRIAGIRDSLASRLGRIRDPLVAAQFEKPKIRELLDVDREYRIKAAQGLLPRIAPRRMNPSHQAWLPVLHTQRGKRHYTALFSNTARAHELGKTNDWVVLYLEGGNGHRQFTIITSTMGPMKGRRIVRGHEEQSRQYYANMVYPDNTQTLALQER